MGLVGQVGQADPLDHYFLVVLENQPDRPNLGGLAGRHCLPDLHFPEVLEVLLLLPLY
jgi:hypothetical protein